MVFVVAGPAFWRSSTQIQQLRSIEAELVWADSLDGSSTYIAIYDTRNFIRNQAYFSICTTIIVGIVLVLANSFVTSMNNHLLIHPIETMI